jgi:hypothetical protein
VYVSESVAGGLTSTAPVSPNYRMRVGVVGMSHATTGTIHVTPSTASIGNGANGTVLSIAGGIQAYQTIATILGYTPPNDTLVVHLAGTETITGAKTFSADQTLSGARQIFTGTSTVLASNDIIYRQATNVLRVGINGSDRGQFDANGFTVVSGSLLFTGTPSVIASSDGIRRSAANTLSFDLNGVSQFTFDTANGMQSAGSIFDITVNSTVPSGSANINIIGNLANALSIKDSATDIHMTFVSTNGAKKTVFAQVVDMQSGHQMKITSVSATYSILATDSIIDCTANTFTATLPTGITNRVYHVKNSGAGVITLATTGGVNIDASATASIAAGASLKVVFNGTKWVSF